MPRSTPPDRSGNPMSKWPWWRRWFGRRSERAAARHLRSLGYRILAANVADREGELDLIALDRDVVVIVEVRSTAGHDLDRIAASVDYRKQKKITQTATRYLARKRLLEGVAVRYDVLVLGWPAETRSPIVRHYLNAFEAVGRFQFHN